MPDQPDIFARTSEGPKPKMLYESTPSRRTDRRELVDPSTAWYTADTILLDKMEEIVTIARQPYFGRDQSPGMSLASWLMCEAFDNRWNPDKARALHLAAMIISRVKP